MRHRRPLVRYLVVPVACAAALATVGAVAGCTDTTTPLASEPAQGPALAAGQVTATERWLVLTRAILGRREVGSPLRTARHLALVAVAQYDAAVAAGTAPVAAGAPRPSESAAVAAASAAVLGALYPVEADSIAAGVAADRDYRARFDTAHRYDAAAGAAIGARVAAAVLARAATDRTDLVWTGAAPSGAGVWAGTAGVPAVSPRWGEARGWFLTSGSQFRPAAPPAYGSAAYQTALTEVRTASDGRTPAQLQLAQFWQFGSGPAGPPGYLTEVGLGLAAAAGFNERQTARALALSSIAMMDATIGCWDAKYTYWYLRPFEGDRAISTPVGRPNFPSYPSAHSCITAAASGVLAGIFPTAAATLDGKVAEAGRSRVVAGLHYSFDVSAGRDLGRSVATLVLVHTPGAREAIPLN